MSVHRLLRKANDPLIDGTEGCSFNVRFWSLATDPFLARADQLEIMRLGS
jgi:hypothetical protein